MLHFAMTHLGCSGMGALDLYSAAATAYCDPAYLSCAKINAGPGKDVKHRETKGSGGMLLAEEQKDHQRLHGPAETPGESTLQRRLPAIFWVYSLLLVAISRMWTAKYPGVADAELFAYIGREWHRGVMPYTQLWDDKPPGILAVNWLAAFSQRQFLALACFEFVAIALALFLLSRIFALLDPKSSIRWIAPFVAASAFAISAYSLGGNYTELYVVPLAALSIYAFLRAWNGIGSGSAWYLLAGVAAGLAAAFKPVGMAPLLASVAFLLLARRRPFAARVTGIALIIAGFIVVWGILEAAFATIGAARMMLDATLIYNLHYGAANHASIANKLLLSVDRLLPVSSVLGCAGAGALLWIYSRLKPEGEALLSTSEADAAALFVLWAGADIAGANAGGRYYPHYFLPALLSLVALACVGLQGILRLSRGIAWRPRTVLFCALLLPIGLMGVRGQLDEYHAVSGNPPYPWEQAARYVRAHRQPQDTLFTFEFTPGVYRVSGSHATTRYASAHYIKDFPAAYTNIGGEILAELHDTPPTFVMYSCDLHPLNPADTVRAQFLNFVATGYHTAYRYGDECVGRHN